MKKENKLLKELEESVNCLNKDEAEKLLEKLISDLKIAERNGESFQVIKSLEISISYVKKRIQKLNETPE